MLSFRQPAHTYAELLLVLILLGVLTALAVPGILHATDVLSVRAARTALAGAATRTRSLAMSRGGAFLRIDEAGFIAVLARDTTQVHMRWDLHGMHGVSLEIENSARSSALLEYDALGVGRLANLTVRIRRGRVAGAVSFSAYGRPREW